MRRRLNDCKSRHVESKTETVTLDVKRAGVASSLKNAQNYLRVRSKKKFLFQYFIQIKFNLLFLKGCNLPELQQLMERKSVFLRSRTLKSLPSASTLTWMKNRRQFAERILFEISKNARAKVVKTGKLLSEVVRPSF